jgi:thiamine-monophosphate kinase
MPHALPPKISSEQDLVAWLSQLPKPNPTVWPLGIGDDAAILAPSTDEEIVISTDMLLEGSCFLLEQAGARRVGRKSLAVNLSDLAAMAARPLGCFLSLALPKNGGGIIAHELIGGLMDLGNQFDCPLIGGDTNSWKGPLAISVTVVGAAAKGGAIQRSGARPGDWLMVTGSLGGSILGHHLDFVPRVHEARNIARSVHINAMIDISDGLARDTSTLCAASNCGAVLHLENIPVSQHAHELQAIASWGIPGKTPLEHALGDGEDYELLFAVSPADGHALLKNQPLAGTLLSKVGECIPQGFWLESEGKRTPLPVCGWQHALEEKAN